MRILATAVLCAIVCLSAIAFTLDAVQKRLDVSTAALIGGDLVINAAMPLDIKFKTLAKEYELLSSENVTFYTMLSNAENFLLTSVKAVDQNYPLLGELKTSNQLDQSGKLSRRGPNPGEIWLESRAVLQLGVKVSDKIHVGDAELVFSAILTSEPDRVADGFTFAPRALMNIADVASTKAVLPGSRVTYKMLFTGQSANIKSFQAKIESAGLGEFSVQTLQSRTGSERNLNLASKYLYLALSVNIVLSAITVIIAANRYSTVHTIDAAVLRCLGASRKQIIMIYGNSMLLIALVIGSIGCLLGFGIEQTVALFLSKYLNLELSNPGLWPLALGMSSSLILVVLFALPALLSLSNTSPIRILHRAGLTTRNSAWRLHFNLSNKIPALLRLAINNIVYNTQHNLLLVFSFTLIICVATVLFVVRNDLLSSWKTQIPADVPNYFALNIPAELSTQYSDFLASQGITINEFYPLVRGSLTKINGEEVSMEPEQGLRQGINRPLNLTWSARLPYENNIIAGSWFTAAELGKPYISIEKEIAERLNVKMGDILTFSINNEDISAQITSIRTVNWGSFTPNFYVIYNPGFIEYFPATYMTSFYMSPDQEPLLLEMVQKYPQINFISVTAMLDQAQTVLQLLSLVIGFIWAFTLLIGILLLLAILISGMHIRMYQNNLMRIFGASKSQLIQIFVLEYILLGGISGGIGSLLAVLGGKYISVQYFSIYYPLHWWIILLGISVGIGTMLLGSLMGARKLFKSPPIQTLRYLS